MTNLALPADWCKNRADEWFMRVIQSVNSYAGCERLRAVEKVWVEEESAGVCFIEDSNPPDGCDKWFPLNWVSTITDELTDELIDTLCKREQTEVDDDRS